MDLCSSDPLLTSLLSRQTGTCQTGSLGFISWILSCPWILFPQPDDELQALEEELSTLTTKTEEVKP